MRTLHSLCVGLLALSCQSAEAGILGTADSHYYGPLKNFEGVGYKEKLQDDGAWRIVANSRGIDGFGFSIGMALYRAAELAKEQGHRYVQILGGSASSNMYRLEDASLFARASDSPAAPLDCRGRSKDPCYTADVASVLELLGGPSGNEPGVAVQTSTDDYGRSVTFVGFGIGAVSAAHPVPEGAPPGADLGAVMAATTRAPTSPGRSLAIVTPTSVAVAAGAPGLTNGVTAPTRAPRPLTPYEQGKLLAQQQGAAR